LYSKKVFFLILVFLGMISAAGQVRQGRQLEAGSIVSLTSKKGILYNGIDNTLAVDTSLYGDADGIIVKSNNGILVHDTCNRYLCIPDKLGTMWLSLYAVKGFDTSKIGFKYFSVINIPEPLLTINDRPVKTPSDISKSELLHCDSLGVYFTDDIPGSQNWMTITEFSLGYSYGGFYVEHVNPSNKFTRETIIILNRIGPDRVISIRAKVKAEGKIMKPLPIYRLTLY
jgi:hypothetical protein